MGRVLGRAPEVAHALRPAAYFEGFDHLVASFAIVQQDEAAGMKLRRGKDPSFSEGGATLQPTPRTALLATRAPRHIPFTVPGAVSCVLYADAFFLEAKLRHKAGWVPANAPLARSRRACNGWGYVIRIGDTAWYDSGSIPEWFIRKFDTSRAYIYMLEVLAQILAVVTLLDHLPEEWQGGVH